MNEKRAHYNLIFDNKGNLIDVELTKEGEDAKCNVIKGEREIAEHLNKLGELYELKSVEGVHAGGIKFSFNPDCIIYIGNIPICICCG